MPPSDYTDLVRDLIEPDDDGNLSLPLPVPGRLSDAYGAPRPGRKHAGQDIAVPLGTPVPARRGGRVAYAGQRGGYGNRIDVEYDDGVSESYSHLSELGVRAGDTIEPGRVLGKSGSTGRSTGPHLHWEASYAGQRHDPLGMIPTGRRRDYSHLVRDLGEIPTPRNPNEPSVTPALEGRVALSDPSSVEPSARPRFALRPSLPSSHVGSPQPQAGPSQPASFSPGESRPRRVIPLDTADDTMQESAKAAAPVREIEHERFGRVREKRRMSDGRVVVIDKSGNEHVIQNPRTKGNRSATYVRPVSQPRGAEAGQPPTPPAGATVVTGGLFAGARGGIDGDSWATPELRARAQSTEEPGRRGGMAAEDDPEIGQIRAYHMARRRGLSHEAAQRAAEGPARNLAEQRRTRGFRSPVENPVGVATARALGTLAKGLTSSSAPPFVPQPIPDPETERRQDVLANQAGINMVQGAMSVTQPLLKTATDVLNLPMKAQGVETTNPWAGENVEYPKEADPWYSQASPAEKAIVDAALPMMQTGGNIAAGVVEAFSGAGAVGKAITVPGWVARLGPRASAIYHSGLSFGGYETAKAVSDFVPDANTSDLENWRDFAVHVGKRGVAGTITGAAQEALPVEALRPLGAAGAAIRGAAGNVIGERAGRAVVGDPAPTEEEALQSGLIGAALGARSGFPGRALRPIGGQHAEAMADPTSPAGRDAQSIAPTEQGRRPIDAVDRGVALPATGPNQIRPNDVAAQPKPGDLIDIPGGQGSARVRRIAPSGNIVVELPGGGVRAFSPAQLGLEVRSGRPGSRQDRAVDGRPATTTVRGDEAAPITVASGVVRGDQTAAGAGRPGADGRGDDDGVSAPHGVEAQPPADTRLAPVPDAAARSGRDGETPAVENAAPVGVEGGAEAGRVEDGARVRVNYPDGRTEEATVVDSDLPGGFIRVEFSDGGRVSLPPENVTAIDAKPTTMIAPETVDTPKAATSATPAESAVAVDKTAVTLTPDELKRRAATGTVPPGVAEDAWVAAHKAAYPVRWKNDPAGAEAFARRKWTEAQGKTRTASAPVKPTVPEPSKKVEPTPAPPEPKKSDPALTRMRTSAESIITKAQESLGRDRLTNTHKRAREAAGATKEANREILIGQTMKNVTDAILAGSTKHLTLVRSRSHVETLESALNDAKHATGRINNERWDKLADRDPVAEDIAGARFPVPQVTVSAVEAIRKAIGPTTRESIAMNRLVLSAKDDWIQLKTADDVERVQRLIVRAVKSSVPKYDIGRLKDGIGPYERLHSLGITDTKQLRTALGEYLKLRGEQLREDPVKAAERALVGRNIPGYFPTPKPLADELVEKAEIEPGMRVLEPSAGKGSLADAIKSAVPDAEIDAIEPVGDLRTILESKGHKLVGRDFLEHKGEYDRIVMNPPFENGQDMDHVRHAFDLLKPGGRVVAIMSEGSFSRSDKKASAFREWLDEVDGTSEKNAEGSFKSSDRPTGVSTRTVVVDKPGEQKPAQITQEMGAGAPVHKFSSTQVEAPKEITQAHKALQAKIPDSDLAGDGKDIDTAHITVRYGIESDDPATVRAALEAHGPVRVTLGKTKAFKPGPGSKDAAPIIVEADSPDLIALNQAVEKSGAPLKKNDYNYKPHMTVAYVKPEVAKKYEGLTDLEGKQFTISEVVFSDRNGNKHVVQLKGKGTATTPVVDSTTTKEDARGQEADTSGEAVRGKVREPRQPSGVSLRGEATDVEIPGEGRSLKATYVVRELSDVHPSHDPHTFAENPNYYYTNDRDYTDKVNRGRVVAQAQGFKAKFLVNDSPTAENGPPIIDTDGNVLGGNSRTMTLARVYKNNPQAAKEYRALVERKAASLGYDESQLAAMKQPILVREVDADALAGHADAQKAITDLNKAGTAALSGSERTIAESKRLSSRAIDFLTGRIEAEGESGTLAQALEGTKGQSIVNRLIEEGVFTEQERPGLLERTATGEWKLSTAGKERVGNLLIGQVFRDLDQLRSASPDTRNKIERIVAPLARIPAEGEWNIREPLRGALDLLEEARATGNRQLDDVARQTSLTRPREYTPDEVTIAKVLQRGPVQAAKAFNVYASEAAGGPSLFGRMSQPDAFAEAFRTAPQPTGKKNTPLPDLSSFDIGDPKGRRDALDALPEGTMLDGWKKKGDAWTKGKTSRSSAQLAANANLVPALRETRGTAKTFADPDRSEDDLLADARRILEERGQLAPGEIAKALGIRRSEADALVARLHKEGGTTPPDALGRIAAPMTSARLQRFAHDTLTKPANEKSTLSFGRVSDENARVIEDTLNVPVKGFERVVDSFGLRHALERHGVEAEKSDNQEPITPEDLRLIPEIVEHPDKVEDRTRPNTPPTIRYSKRFNGTVYYLEEVRSRPHQLVLKTMYKRAAKSRALEVPGSGTSETLGATRPATPALPQGRGPDRSGQDSSIPPKGGKGGKFGDPDDGDGNPPVAPPDPITDDAEDLAVFEAAAHANMRMPMESAPAPGAESGKVSSTHVIRAYEAVLKAAGQNTPIRVGRMGQAARTARGFFKPHEEVIRLKTANNIPTAAHEAGHSLQKAIWQTIKSKEFRAQLPPAVKRELSALGKALYGSRKPAAGYTGEGFAEFTRYYLTRDDVATVAPNALKFFEGTVLPNNPQVAKALAEARKVTDTYRNEGAKNRASANIQKGPTLRQRVDRALTALRAAPTDFVDEFTPLLRLSRQYEQSTGKALRPGRDPYLVASALRGTASAKVEHMLFRGMVDAAANPTGPALADAAAIVKGRREEFTTYLWARRAQERLAQGKNPGMTTEDADYLVNTLGTPEFQLAADKVYEWNDGVLEYVKQMVPDLAPAIAKIRAISVDYVPLNRAFDDPSIDMAGRISRQAGGNPLKRMKGSGRRIQDIFPQMIANAETMVSMAHKRRVLDLITRLADVEGMGHILEEVPKDQIPHDESIERIKNQLERAGADLSQANLDELITFFTPAQTPKGKDPILPIMRGGEVRWYHVNPELYNSLAGVDLYRLPKVFDWIAGAPARAFRLGTTGLRPAFSLFTNPVRDARTFMMQTRSHKNPAKLAAAYVQGMSEALDPRRLAGRHTPMLDTFVRLGGQLGQPLGADVQQTRRPAKALFQGPVERVVRSPINALRELLSLPEAGPRLAELHAIADEVGWDKKSPLTFDQMVQLGLAAKQVTVDFSAMGRVGKVMNQAIPFFNVAIQGPRIVGRTLKERPGRTAAWGLTAITIPALALWWKNKDEEWYKDLTDREKFAFYHIPADDQRLKIPRAFEWDNLFSVIPEAIFDSWYRKDPEAVRGAIGHVFESSTPNTLPVLLSAAKEQWSNNIAYFDRPIVSRSEHDLIPGEQRNEYTSGVAKWLGDTFPETVSPKRVDALIRGIGGGVAGDLAAQTDIGRVRTREREMSDLPVIGKAFATGGKEGISSKAVDKFYEEYDRIVALEKSKVRSESMDDKKRRGEFEDANAALKILRETSKELPNLSDRQAIQRKMREIAQQALSGSAIWDAGLSGVVPEGEARTKLGDLQGSAGNRRKGDVAAKAVATTTAYQSAAPDHQKLLEKWARNQGAKGKIRLQNVEQQAANRLRLNQLREAALTRLRSSSSYQQSTPEQKKAREKALRQEFKQE